MDSVDPQIAACEAFLQVFRAEVGAAGVGDAQTARIPGFPHLRSSRFLASFRDDLSAGRRQPWLLALRALGQAGEQVELANLPDEPATWQALGVPDRGAAAARLDECGDRLLARDRGQPGALDRLRERAAVPDAYADYQRILGLYPLTALAARQGVGNLYAGIRSTFQLPEQALPVTGTLVDYRPPAGAGVGLPADYASLPRDALGRPQLSSGRLEALLRRHAPVWRVDVAAAADMIGQPYWATANRLEIERQQPVVFTKVSYTRWQEHTLLQLNYIVWFSARPLTGPWDMLGGHLDGVTWRVTLAPDGTPLVYDAMHNCGCYHMAFPTQRLEVDQPDSLWQEPLMVPAAAPVLGSDQRIRIRLEHGTHYLQAVTAVDNAQAGEAYVYRDYSTLRSLPYVTGERRSMFNPEGLVPGTERLEQWLLWPMGVPEPGAMRQWGTHATAFVGKRHFDDPDLIERYFAPVH